MGGEAGLQTPSGPLMSASSSIAFPPSLGRACTSRPLGSLPLHVASTAPALIYSLCSHPRHLMRIPLQTTRSRTASSRHLPSATTLTSRCRKGTEVSAAPRTAMPLMSSSSSSGCPHTSTSGRVSKVLRSCSSSSSACPDLACSAVLSSRA